MIIKISYKFDTNDKFTLSDPNEHGCIDKNVKYGDVIYDFVGSVKFEDKNRTICIDNATMFLSKLICDGIHVNYCQYKLIGKFFNIITNMIYHMNRHEEGSKDNIFKYTVDESCGHSAFEMLIFD